MYSVPLCALLTSKLASCVEREDKMTWSGDCTLYTVRVQHTDRATHIMIYIIHHTLITHTYMQQLYDDRLDVISHIACLSEGGAVTDHHGNIQVLGQALG